MHLFPIEPVPRQEGRADLSQFMTPAWAAQAIVDEFWPDLDASDLVLEPSCGRGAFLQAIPDEVPAIGVELDPVLAEQARAMTGREILCGDFRTIDLTGAFDNGRHTQTHDSLGRQRKETRVGVERGQREARSANDRNERPHPAQVEELQGAARADRPLSAVADRSHRDRSHAGPTLILGNPPYRMKLLEAFLDRAYDLLPDNGQCGFLLGTQMLQTPNTVLRWNERWSLDQRIVPRTLFPRAIRPLTFVLFTKDRRQHWLGGFLLYRECADINALGRDVKLMLIHGKPNRSCWRAVVEWGLRKLGGRASLRDLYDAIEPRRPTDNRFWQPKIRQTLQRHFHSLGEGRWALLPEAA